MNSFCTVGSKGGANFASKLEDIGTLCQNGDMQVHCVSKGGTEFLQFLYSRLQG